MVNEIDYMKSREGAVANGTYLSALRGSTRQGRPSKRKLTANRIFIIQ
jgi:hypothetical protein